MITTLLFDLGGTLHSVIRKEDSMRRFAKRLLSRLSDYGIVLDTTPERLAISLHENAEAYKHLSEQTLTEFPPAKIWNEYYLKEFNIGEERLAPIAEELSFLYDYDRLTLMRKPRLRETIEELHDMGIRMGIISNIISTSLVPHMLKEYGIAEYMECIVMSSETGIRKPDPRIFDIALKQMGVTAAETGYVGDTISRDVLGARNAHLGLAVRLDNPSIAHRDAAFHGPDAPEADYIIHELYELPEILRAINENPTTAKEAEHMTDTIFFDVGNTLRIVIPDKEFSDAAERELMELVGATEPHDVFFAKLQERWEKYRKTVKKTLLDAGEMELWTQHLLPDYDPERVAAHAGRLTRLWRDHDGRRVPREDVKSTIIELDRRGYTLGIIANTITETEIPDWMIADQVAHYFKAVILSSKVRLRKPDPEIYYLACRAIGKKPEQCAYVGDNPIRDVEGTRKAGFAMMIRIDEPDTIKKEPQEIILQPDYTITRISELLDIFPPLNKQEEN